MFRLILALITGAGIFLLGLRESRLLFSRADISEKIRSSASRISSGIRFRRSAKRELLSELPFENCGTLELADESEVLSFLHTVSFPFGEREGRETARFISSLGKGTLEEQIRLSDAFKEFWGEVHREAKAEYEKRSRLSLTLGALGGLAVSIIIM